jgi:predicted CXXCH cytochrome family protein
MKAQTMLALLARPSASLAAALLFVLAALPREAAGSEAQVPAFAGSETCTECHKSEAENWSQSDHAHAWMPVFEETVLGDFNDASFTHKGITTRFTRDGGQFVIETENAEGALERFEVAGVVGISPLQQYLLSPEPGRLQAFDIAWDTEKDRWFAVFPDQELLPGDGLHWSGAYKSWEARCAECHATGYSRNYDQQTRAYDPLFSEIGVGCEACHGPGQAHLDWAQAPDAWNRDILPGLTGKGFTIDIATSAETQIQQCAGCHSRREAFFDGNPLPGTPYHDSYNLALLRNGLYEADGAMRDEVYVYGSFLQSKMYAQGVGCADCHEPHSGALRASGDALCAQCHNREGNTRFPTLRLAEYATPEHTFHPPESEGARCAACHMGERAYMVNDWRSDHNFRIPRPDISEITGGPDVCTDCHTGQTAGWAAAEIASRYPYDARRGPHFATVMAAARWAPEAQIDELMALAGRTDLAPIIRATALDLLVPVSTQAIADQAAGLLEDPDPLVRAAAAALQRPLVPLDRLTRLLPALQDPARTVRISAAKSLLDVMASPTPVTAAPLQAASAEWRSSLSSRADFPETHLQIGGAALGMRNLRVAESAFREAISLDPQLVDGWVMIARIQAASGDMEGAARALDEALALNPGQEMLEALKADLEASGGN